MACLLVCWLVCVLLYPILDCIVCVVYVTFVLVACLYLVLFWLVVLCPYFSQGRWLLAIALCNTFYACDPDPLSERAVSSHNMSRNTASGSIHCLPVSIRVFQWVHNTIEFKIATSLLITSIETAKNENPSKNWVSTV